MKDVLRYTVSPLALLLLWELAVRLGAVDGRFFPAPSSIVLHMATDDIAQQLLTETLASLRRLAIGFVVGGAAGFMAGLAMGLRRGVRAAGFPLIAMFYPLPKIALFPLVMLILGIGDASKIAVIALGSFFLLAIHVLRGVDQLNPQYFDLLRVFNISARDGLRFVVIPGTLPAVFTGLRLAIGYSLVMVVATEFSGANNGIGYLIWQSWEIFALKTMYAGLFVIAALGIGFSYLLDVAERKAIRWHPPGGLRMG